MLHIEINKTIYIATLLLMPNIITAGEWHAIGNVEITEHKVEDELWAHLNSNSPVELRPRKSYTYQYLDKGNSVIYINAFCNTWSRKNLNTRLLVVKDGGSCYFSIHYNRINRKFTDLTINGEA